MTNQIHRLFTLAAATAMAFGTYAQGGTREVRAFNGGYASLLTVQSLNSQLGKAPQDSLTKEEVEGLIYMREEENLARDVYSVLAKKWGSRPFGNITQAEFSHTAWVKTLLDKYGIVDPSTKLAPGKFKDKSLQKLYDQLIKQGNVSRVEALKVGATIEDVDLFDLERWSKSNKRPDIQLVYDNLARGSRNHLRAFVRNLKNSGVTYKPQYITQETFDEITGSASQTGAVVSKSSAKLQKIASSATFYTVDVASPVNRIALYLEQEAIAMGFKVTAQHDLQASLAKEGRDVNPTLVVELCQPEVAYNALTDMPIFASAMPCRIALTESNGVTTISMIQPTALANAITGAREAESLAMAIQKNLVTILDKTSKRRPNLEDSWFDVNLPYKMALMASNKGESLKTARAIVRTKQQWKALVEKFGKSDHILTSDSGWQSMTTQVMTTLDRSEVQASSGNNAEAHKILENVRFIWATYRDKLNQNNFTDALFHFHDAMEIAVNVPQGTSIVAASAKSLVALKATWKSALMSKIPKLGPDQTTMRQMMFEEVGTIIGNIERGISDNDDTDVSKNLSLLKPAYVKLYLQFG